MLPGWWDKHEEQEQCQEHPAVVHSTSGLQHWAWGAACDDEASAPRPPPMLRRGPKPSVSPLPRSTAGLPSTQGNQVLVSSFRDVFLFPWSQSQRHVKGIWGCTSSWLVCCCTASSQAPPGPRGNMSVPQPLLPSPLAPQGLAFLEAGEEWSSYASDCLQTLARLWEAQANFWIKLEKKRGKNLNSGTEKTIHPTKIVEEHPVQRTVAMQRGVVGMASESSKPLWVARGLRSMCALSRRGAWELRHSPRTSSLHGGERQVCLPRG